MLRSRIGSLSSEEIGDKRLTAKHALRTALTVQNVEFGDQNVKIFFMKIIGGNNQANCTLDHVLRSQIDPLSSEEIRDKRVLSILIFEAHEPYKMQICETKM